jgi:hypothetical protein
MKPLELIILIFLAFSFSNGEKTLVKTIDVGSATGPELKNLSEIATDIKYIPLETHPDAFMKYINYFKAAGDKFYINAITELLCFDKSGKFLYKIDQQRRGPKEYIYLSDFDIRPEKSLLITLTRGKLFFYDETATGFRFAKQLDLKVQPQSCDFIPGQDNILLAFSASTGENKYQCVGITPGGDTLFKQPNHYRFTRQSKVMMSFRIENVINRNKDLLSIKGLLTDTMFTITGDYKFIPGLILKTGGKGITPDFLANIPITDAKLANPTVKLLILTEILETDRYLLYRYYYLNDKNWGVYDKNTGGIRQFEVKKPLKDDISGGINIEPKFACGGLIYSWTDALTFKKYMLENESQNIEMKNPVRASELR